MITGLSFLGIQLESHKNTIPLNESEVWIDTHSILVG